MGFCRVAKGAREFLKETVGEAVVESVLTLLACTLLAGLVLTAYMSWSFSPRLTLVGATLLGLFPAYGAWVRLRAPVKGHRRRLAALAVTGFTVTAATAVFLLLYATGCDCL